MIRRVRAQHRWTLLVSSSVVISYVTRITDRQTIAYVMLETQTITYIIWETQTTTFVMLETRTITYINWETQAITYVIPWLWRHTLTSFPYYGDMNDYLTSFPDNGDTDGLRNLWHLIWINATDYTEKFYHFGEPWQNNSFVVTEMRLRIPETTNYCYGNGMVTWLQEPKYKKL